MDEEVLFLVRHINNDEIHWTAQLSLLMWRITELKTMILELMPTNAEKSLERTYQFPVSQFDVEQLVELGDGIPDVNWFRRFQYAGFLQLRLSLGTRLCVCSPSDSFRTNDD